MTDAPRRPTRGSGPVRPFPTAEEDAFRETTTAPSSRYEGPGSSYKLAFTDDDFLLREELRPVRLQLEWLKPQLVQDEQGVEATVVLFGSARILPPDAAADELAAFRADPATPPATLRIAERKLATSHYYDEARRFAGGVGRRTAGGKSLVVVTGGGPGIMEAGNRGADERGEKSIGLNIVLSREQTPNDYITPELCFQFHYFALRKMHFLMRAVAVVAFPGGFGTLDELFEVLTLVQTGKAHLRPILLFGRDFWTRLVDFEWLVETGMISPEDLQLFHFVETAEEAWQVLETKHGFLRT